MAQSIVTFCDACLAAGVQVPAETWQVMAMAPGTRKQVAYEVDACPDHAKAYQELADFLADHARKSGATPVLVTMDPPPPGNRASKASQGAQAAPAATACPICQHPLKDTPTALDSHSRHIHGITAAEASGEAHLACGHEGCDRRFSAPQGRANHWRLQHDGVRPPGI